MTEEQKYAIEWEKSANDFEKQEVYKKLTEQLSSYTIIFEIGCGTGQSTLSLLENGHGVIAVEQNKECLSRAKERVKKTQYAVKNTPENLKPGEVYFINGDVSDHIFLNSFLNNIEIDVVICWNVGTYWDKTRYESTIPKLSTAGFSVNYITSNTESAYVELIISYACQIAKVKSCPLHIVERRTEEMTSEKDTYYVGLKEMFGFSCIDYKNIRASTLSTGGRKMSSKGQEIKKDRIDIIINSIFIK